MTSAQRAICDNLGRAEQTLAVTRPPADSEEIRRLCDTQLSAARRMGCAQFGVLREEPGTVAGWYCGDVPEANPIVVPAPPPGATSHERARRTMCSTLAAEEYALMQGRPAWGDPEVRRFCDTRGKVAATWNCGEFGVLSATPGSAAHWYCHSTPDPDAMPAPVEITKRATVAAPPAPPAPPAPGQGIVTEPAAAAAAAEEQGDEGAVWSGEPAAEGMFGGGGYSQGSFAFGMAPGTMGTPQTMVNPQAPPASAYGPYVEVSSPETGVKAFCRMNLDHQIFVCDTPVHGTFRDGQGNPMICDRATWMCKPAAR